MLDDGTDPDDIHKGLERWTTKPLPPRFLPDMVSDVVKARSAPKEKTRFDEKTEANRAVMMRLVSEANEARASRLMAEANEVRASRSAPFGIAGVLGLPPIPRERE